MSEQQLCGVHSQLEDGAQSLVQVWNAIEVAHNGLGRLPQRGPLPKTGPVILYIPSPEGQIAVVLAEQLSDAVRALNWPPSTVRPSGRYTEGPSCRSLRESSPLLSRPLSALQRGRPQLVHSPADLSRVPRCAGIYRIIRRSTGGDWEIYVGQAIDLRRRLANHEKIDKWGWDGIDRIEILRVKPPTPGVPVLLVDLDAAEVYHIKRARVRELDGRPVVANVTCGRNGRKGHDTTHVLIWTPAPTPVLRSEGLVDPRRPRLVPAPDLGAPPREHTGPFAAQTPYARVGRTLPRLADHDDSYEPAEQAQQARLTDDAARDYVMRIGKVPLVTAEQEVGLAKSMEAGVLAEENLAAHPDMNMEKRIGFEWAVEAGRRSKNDLLASNLRLVVSLAKRYAGRGIEFSDLIQEGNLGLMQAVEEFDHTKGYKFSTFATWWIRQAITQAMADHELMLPIPAHMSEVVDKMVRVQRQFLQDVGREPTFEELAAELDLTPDEAIEVQRYGLEPRQPTGGQNFWPPGDREFTDWLGDLKYRGELIPMSTTTFELDDWEFGDRESTDWLGDLLVDSESADPDDLVESCLLRQQCEKGLESLSDPDVGVVQMIGLTDSRPCRQCGYVSVGCPRRRRGTGT